MPQTVLPCHHTQLCRFPSQDTGTLLSLCSPPPSTSHLLHLPHFWVWKLYSTSPSHRAPSSRSCTFLSEIKKMRRAVLPAVLLCSWSSLQDSAPPEHFIGRPCPPCSLASFTPPVPPSVGSDAAERRWEQWLGKIREGTNSNAWLVTIHKCLPNLITQL